MKKINQWICLLLAGTMLFTADTTAYADFSGRGTNPASYTVSCAQRESGAQKGDVKEDGAQKDGAKEDSAGEGSSRHELELDDFSDGLASLYEEYDKDNDYVPQKPGEETDYAYQTGRIIVKSDQSVVDAAAQAVVGPYHGIYVLQYADAETAERAAVRYEGQAGVEFVQPDRVFQAEPEGDASAQRGMSLQAAFPQDWAPGVCKFSVMQEILLEKYGAEEKIPQIVVADIDTGIAAAHPLLTDRVLPNGKSFAGDSSSVADLNGHGTATAGCITLNTLNNVKILPIRLFYGLASSYTSTGVYDCIEYAVEQKADIISMSFGSGMADPLEKQAVADAAKAGIILVAAYGNDGRDTVSKYPACYDNVIGVSSIKKDLQMSDFSNYGLHVDLSAPGTDIFTLNRKNDYMVTSGTSFACPYVSAGAALIKSYNPRLTQSQVTHILYDNVIDCGPKGWDKRFGHGVLCFADIADYLADPANDRYTHEILRVSFASNGGSAVPAQNVTYGKQAAKPSSTRNGYHLLGWYTDGKLTREYSFNSPVTADLTLYAKWQKHVYSEKKVAVRAATYTAGGSKTYTCTVCHKGTTEVKLARLKLKAPAKLSSKRLKKGVQLSWKKVAGASGYYIERKVSGGKWKRVKTIKGSKTVTCTDKTAAKKKTYTYRVRAYNQVQKSAYRTGKAVKKAK